MRWYRRLTRFCQGSSHLGLLLRNLAKGTDLSLRSQDDLDAIASSLHGRPRALHGFTTPLAVFSHMPAMAQQAPVLSQ